MIMRNLQKSRMAPKQPATIVSESELPSFLVNSNNDSNVSNSSSSSNAMTGIGINNDIAPGVSSSSSSSNKRKHLYDGSYKEDYDDGNNHLKKFIENSRKTNDATDPSHSAVNTFDDDDDDIWLDGAVDISRANADSKLKLCIANQRAKGNKSLNASSSGNAVSCRSSSARSRGTAVTTASITSEIRPTLVGCPFINDEVPLVMQEYDITSDARPSVHKYINRYLKAFQQEGVQALWKSYLNKSGFILADDMGLGTSLHTLLIRIFIYTQTLTVHHTSSYTSLGKTIQLISLLSIIYDKTGLSEVDMNNTYKRGEYFKSNGGKQEDYIPPSLLVVPASIKDNWVNELNRWGYFSIAIPSNNSDNSVIDSCIRGKKQLLICPYDYMTKHSEQLSGITWSVIIYDEGHCLRTRTTLVHIAASRINKVRSIIIVSGTIMSNKCDELWSIVTLVKKGKWITSEEYQSEYAGPIRKMMLSGANELAIADGMRAREKLTNIMKQMMIKRTKEQYKEALNLQGKDDIVIMCELTALQASMYRQFLSLPEMKLLAAKGTIDELYAKKVEFEPMRVKREAYLWHQHHPTGDICRHRCLYCLSLPAITVLTQLASHPSLLQAVDDMTPASQLKAKFFSSCFDNDTTTTLGGVYSNRLNSIKNNMYAGKMTALNSLVKYFSSYSEKILIFSSKVSLLDCIQNHLSTTMNLHSLRIDGTVAACVRQSLVDTFNETQGPCIMLLTTGAGGVGLNLQTATRVIIYDVNWNPSNDQQSQDRAYRIGQTKHVSVYRLVAKGTIEEVQYMRQLYKQELVRNVIDGKSGAQSFTDDDIFGLKNIFQYNPTQSILALVRNKYAPTNRSDASSTADAESDDDGDGDDALDLSSKGSLQKKKNNEEDLQFIRSASVKTARLVDSMRQEALAGDDSCGTNASVASKTKNGMSLLHLIGIDPSTAHENLDMLKEKNAGGDAAVKPKTKRKSITNTTPTTPLVSSPAASTPVSASVSVSSKTSSRANDNDNIGNLGTVKSCASRSSSSDITSVDKSSVKPTTTSFTFKRPSYLDKSL